MRTRLVRALSRVKRDSVVLEHPGATIRWLVMWARWPYTSNAMIARFEELLEDGVVELSGHQQQGDPLIELLDYVEPKPHLLALPEVVPVPAQRPLPGR